MACSSEMRGRIVFETNQPKIKIKKLGTPAEMRIMEELKKNRFKCYEIIKIK